jgi:hypothetical protein
MNVEADKGRPAGSANGQNGVGDKLDAAPQPHADAKPPSAALVEAIRGLVREEMGQAASEEATPAPSRSDAFWLFLCLANVAMLLWWTPEAVLENPKLEFLVKLIPLVGGYLFALGYLWFRNNLLAAGRSGKFKAAQLLLAAVLLPAGLSQTNIFHLKPLLEPDKAVTVSVGGEEVDPKRIWLPLGTHEFKIRFGRKEGADRWEERTFKLGPWQMLKALWARPRWPLLYKITFIYSASDVEVVVRRVEGEYDAGFLETLRNPPDDLHVKWEEGESQPTFVYSCTAKSFGGVGGSESVSLPPGTYSMYARKKGCGQSDPLTVVIGLEKPATQADFSLLKCER